MTNDAPIPMVCPNCHCDVLLNGSPVPGPISAAIRLRHETLGTQVQCPQCGEPFIHKAHPTPAPIGIPVQGQRLI